MRPCDWCGDTDGVVGEALDVWPASSGAEPPTHCDELCVACFELAESGWRPRRTGSA